MKRGHWSYGWRPDPDEYFVEYGQSYEEPLYSLKFPSFEWAALIGGALIDITGGGSEVIQEGKIVGRVRDEYIADLICEAVTAFTSDWEDPPRWSHRPFEGLPTPEAMPAKVLKMLQTAS